MRLKQKNVALVGLLLLLGIGAGCGRRQAPLPAPSSRPGSAPSSPGLARTGFTIQVGAFAKVENAAKFTAALRKQGVDAYYFLYRSGLYKVRFGDYPNRQAAAQVADRVRKTGLIDDYYLVSPELYSVSTENISGLREKLVVTAESYLDLPYQWGGSSPEEGFDCSGLAMAVYRLNGLNLPRSAREQFQAGSAVEENRLQPGDLVFFHTGGGERITHVGIYLGDTIFIHAPGTGQTIRKASLLHTYFAARYAGGRTYLR